jgi:RimJ/RimL family protein N-acetyltransferase
MPIAHSELSKGWFVEVIRTVRLVLRDFEEMDWRSVHEYASDEEVVRYMPWGPNTVEDSKNFTKASIRSQQQEPRRNYSLAVVLKSQNRLIGGCGIYVSNPDEREGYIGYILNRNYWGQGYATEAAKALIEFGFEHLKLHRIYATCDPTNKASARVLEKAGMQLEGHIREYRWVKGKWRDSLQYAIIDREWIRLK